MQKRIKWMVAFALAVITVCLLSLSVSATYYEPDGTSSEEYLFPESECNRTLIVNCVDQNGSTVKKVTYHTKHGEDDLISLSLYGYDITDFTSDQSLLETCKITWASSTGLCDSAYIQIRYYFRTGLSKSTMTATVTVRKSEAATVNVNHYTIDANGTKTLYATESKTVSYYDYVTFSAKTITGYKLKDGYSSTLSGNFSYSWVGASLNIPKSPRPYSYNFINTDLSKNMDEWSTYHESKQGKMDYCINRVWTISFVYELKTYAVSFNSNGGSGSPASVTKTYGVALTLPTEIPTKSGYTFKGWGLSSTTTYASYQPGGTYSSNMARTLYAIWESNAPTTYTVSYNANGGSGAPSSQTKTQNVALTLSSTKPTRNGYTFLGWSTNSAATSATYAAGGSYTGNSGLTLYAVWKKNPSTYVISYSANGGSGAPSSQTKTENVALTLSSVKPTRTNYTFLGWSTISSATSATYTAGGSYTANAGATLYAVWSYSPTLYTVQYNANGGSGAPSSQTKTYNVTLSLSTVKPTRLNYSFLGWNTSSTATYASYYAGGNYTANANTTLYAVWSYNPATYTVSYSANGGSGAPASQVKTYDVELTLSTTVPTKSGYTFLGWSTSSTGTSASYAAGGSYTANAGTTLYAVWEKINYNFSISGLTVSESEVSRYGIISVKVRTDNWDQKNAYSSVPVQLYYDGKLISTQNVNFAAYGVSNLTFSLNVGAVTGTHTIEVRVNWAEHLKETVTNNNSVSTTVTVKEYEYDFSMNPVTVTDDYYAGTTVISSFTVSNNGSLDVLPSDNHSVSFTAYYYNGSSKVIVSSQTWSNVVIPANGTNLVYFKWSIPSTLAGKTVYCECCANATSALNEPDRTNNISTVTKVIQSFTESQTPNTGYEASAPSGYTTVSAPTATTGSKTWNMWVYENGVLVLKTYGIRVTTTNPTVTPSSACSTAVYSGGKWTMKSGYGISLSWSPILTSLSGYTMPGNNAYTSAQYVYAKFPEYRYLTAVGQFRTLENVSGVYRFVENADADNSERVHFIPVYVGDGNYTVSVTATQIWTPAGMITATRNANAVTIDGTIYDDFYQG